MAAQKYKREHIVTLLRQFEARVTNNKETPQACNGAETSLQTYYR